MGSSDNIFSELFSAIKSWIPWRSDPADISRNFWMPDQSCRVCYDCDIQFTFLNRRHHCRRCGRVFCGKCTSNSIPVICTYPKTLWEEWERIRVYNYCFRQWEQQNIHSNEYGGRPDNQEFCVSPDGGEIFATPRGGYHTPKAGFHTPTGRDSLISLPNSIGSYKDEARGSPDTSSSQPFLLENSADRPSTVTSGEINNLIEDREMPPSSPYEFSAIRSDDDDEYTEHQSDCDSRRYTQIDRYESRPELDESVNPMYPHQGPLDGDKLGTKCLVSSSLQHSFISEGYDGVP